MNLFSLTGRVALGALEAAALRPPAVAVHDDRDVLGARRPDRRAARDFPLGHGDAT